MSACNRRSALRRSAVVAICATIACILHTNDAHAGRKRQAAKPAAARVKRVPKPRSAPSTPETAPAAATEPAVEPTPTAPPAQADAKPAGPMPEPYEYRPGKDSTEAKEKDRSGDESRKETSESTTKDGQPKDAPQEAPQAPPRSLQPLHLDAKLTGNTDVLLGFVGVGAALDFGVARAGPGTISVGAAGEYNFCASVCWALNAITPFEFGQRQISLWGRASYHIDIKGKIGQRLDVYPFAMVGPTFASASLRFDDSGTEYRGSDTAIAIGGGAGVNFFIAGPLFVGGEARARYARGTYRYELVSGNEETIAEGQASSWSMTGVDIMLAFGARF
jgi:hypothetical protein